MTKLHPITKISIVFILSFVVLIFSNVFDLIGLLIFIIILGLLTKIPIFSRKFRKLIIGILISSLSVYIVWCFFTPVEGEIIFFETWVGKWHILITDQSIYVASRYYLRIINMFFLMIFFFAGISDRDLIHGLRSVKVPFTVTLIISMTFRGLSMFQQEYSIVREAMMTRGVEFERASIPKRIKNFISIFIVLIVLMFKKTEDMAASIESRGIPLRSKNRTTYHYFPIKKKDYAILIGLFILLFFSIIISLFNKSFVSLFLELF